MLIFDAHLHLNGSISLEYLKNTAIKNNCLDVYEKLVSEEDLWKKFGFVHQIIQTTEDIKLAVVDVVGHSKADILEIRTTPKVMKEQGVELYIQSFVQGLTEAKNLYPSKKAHGLLSIDRTRHSLKDAEWIIDAAVKEKQSSGTIVGIDLSGNYLAERTLTGNDLYFAIKYALEKDIGLALHVGETDSDIERQDFDLILKAVDEYQGAIHGKVRLGHAAYRTASQDEIIKKHQIPVEICPSCHRYLEWWKEDKPHPILTLYQFRTQVIPGTDDELLFGSDAKKEQQILDDMLKIPIDISALDQDDLQDKVSEQRKRYMFS